MLSQLWIAMTVAICQEYREYTSPPQMTWSHEYMKSGVTAPVKTWWIKTLDQSVETWPSEYNSMRIYQISEQNMIPAAVNRERTKFIHSDSIRTSQKWCPNSSLTSKTSARDSGGIGKAINDLEHTLVMLITKRWQGKLMRQQYVVAYMLFPRRRVGSMFILALNCLC